MEKEDGKKKKGKRRKISSKIFERFRLTVRQAYIVIYELFTQWIIHRRKIGILATLDRTWYAIWKGVCSEVRYARETLYLNAISSRPGWMRALVGTRFIDKITNNDRQTAAFESYIVATRKEDGGGKGGKKMRKRRKCRKSYLSSSFVCLVIFSADRYW